MLTISLFDDSLSSTLRSVDCNGGLSYSPRGPACPTVPGALHPAASAHHGLPEGMSVCAKTRNSREMRYALFLGTSKPCQLHFAELSFAHLLRNNAEVCIGSFSSYLSRVCAISITLRCIIYALAHTPMYVSVGTSHSFYGGLNFTPVSFHCGRCFVLHVQHNMISSV